MKDKRKKRDATAFLSPRGRVPLEKHPRDVNIDDRKTRLCAGRLCARPHDFRGPKIFRLNQALLAFVFAVQKRRKKCAQKFPGTLSPGRERPPSPTSRQNGARRRDRREFKSYRTIFFSSSSSSEAFLRVVVFGAPRQRKFSKEEQRPPLKP